MDDLLYNACIRYFTSLADYGYRNEEDVKKLLFYVYIQELVNTTSLAIPEADYKSLENALYCLYGTTCLIPYPDYCERPMYAHLGDIAELSARMAKVEEVNADQDELLATHTGQISDIQALDERQNSRLDNIELLDTRQNERLDTIEGTNVTKDETDIEEINDIIL